MKLCVVTASTQPLRAWSCLQSWGDVPIYLVTNGPNAYLTDATTPPSAGLLVNVHEDEYLGTVPAFARGVDRALADGFDIIACFHDDLEIHDHAWAEKVVRFFAKNPACGLLGFGGAIGLGAENIYSVPYEPMQLARVGFRSNLVDAENHGLRSLIPEKVACLDGFSQIGRAAFWRGYAANPQHPDLVNQIAQLPQIPDTVTALETLQRAGMVHHAYDSALGLLAHTRGWETWYLPIRCRHYGGQTAVGDQGYQQWARAQVEGGDHGFWEHAHTALYQLGKGTLPIRV